MWVSYMVMFLYFYFAYAIINYVIVMNALNGQNKTGRGPVIEAIFQSIFALVSSLFWPFLWYVLIRKIIAFSQDKRGGGSGT